MKFHATFFLLALAYLASETSANCCEGGKGAPEFCQLLDELEEDVKESVLEGLGPDCEGIHTILNNLLQAETEHDLSKRKPNFIRFGKRKPNYIRFGKRKPNYIRFGKRKPNYIRFEAAAASTEKRNEGPNFLRFGKRKPNFLRFGKRKPNFLRFGKRGADEGPNFLRFGKRPDAGPNFLRFGKRSADQGDDFTRNMRKPNFLRFGKRLLHHLLPHSPLPTPKLPSLQSTRLHRMCLLSHPTVRSLGIATQSNTISGLQASVVTSPSTGTSANPTSFAS